MRFHHSVQEVLVIEKLRSEGTLTMEQVARKLPQLSWVELFHAIDRLSRRGDLILRRRGVEYELHDGGRPLMHESETAVRSDGRT
jgi:hypothetical protein